jgi:hypothetical protein
MATKQVKNLSAQTTTTTVASGEKLVKVNDSNVTTLITADNLKAAMLGGLNLNALEDGVFIMYHRKSDNFPLMVKPHKWASLQTSGEIADGVVVCEGGKLLVVAPTETAGYWGSANVSGGGVTTTDRVTAYSDWAGKANTAAQITHDELSGAAYAPGYCNNYSRENANGKGLTAGKWWLPSLGELFMIYSNMLKINYALSLISGATQLAETAYWSSTEYSSAGAWLLGLYYGDTGGITKATSQFRVRAVSAFIS